MKKQIKLCPECGCETLSVAIITPTGIISRIMSIGKKDHPAVLTCTNCGHKEEDGTGRKLKVVTK